MPAGFIRDYLVIRNGDRDEDEPGFRAPGVADPDGAGGAELPVFIEPREGTPAPGDPKRNEDNSTGIIGLVYTGGIITGVLEKFRRKVTFDFWVRTTTPQLAQAVDSRLRLILHDRRNWDMAGLTVIESRQWRPLQPIGHGSQGYSYTLSYLFELYASSGD